MNSNKNVLLCPLDWGLGHASRCVPLINTFLKAGVNVFIAAEGRPLAFLQKEFPELKFIRLSGYGITYRKKGGFGFKLFIILFKIMKSIIAEHFKLKKLIKEYDIDIVFSDNRYGLWNKKVRSVFMTHQILIKSPVKSKIIEKLLFYISKTLIEKFDECWIPDVEGSENLTGDLSHSYTIDIPCFFIGPLSRFKPLDFTIDNHKNDILVILSGPEPQRSIFEQIMIEELEKRNLNSVIVSGLPEKDDVFVKINQLKIFSHLDSAHLLLMILQSDIIISRSGYSTIMDLAVLGKKAILVPTPGQSEQEYLAEYLNGKKYYYAVSQKDFNLSDAIAESADYKGIQLKNDEEVLYKRVIQLINQSSKIKNR